MARWADRALRAGQPRAGTGGSYDRPEAIGDELFSTSVKPTRCIATLIDFRLPARMSALYSFEFLLRPIDFCQTSRKVAVTPVEDRAMPQA